MPLTDTFPQWLPSPSSQSCLKGFLGSVPPPPLSLREGLIFLLAQLKTRSLNYTEPGMCYCVWMKPCVGLSSASQAVARQLGAEPVALISLTQKKAVLGADPTKAARCRSSWTSNHRWTRSQLQHSLCAAFQSSPAAQALLPVALITAGQSPYFTTVYYFQYLKITSVKLFVPEPCPP